ncbi:MAG: hypothetical protein R2827_12545 [Bdellovibrionales bacterium]
MALGIGLIGMGYGIEQLRNLMGVGMALVFLSLALRLTFKYDLKIENITQYFCSGNIRDSI